MPEPSSAARELDGNREWSAIALLTCAYLLGAVAFVIPFSMLVIPETQVIPGFHHNQDAENFSFAVAFIVLLPLATWLVPRFARRFADPARTLPLAAVSSLGLGLVVGFVRVSEELPWGGGIGVAAIAFGLWIAGVAVLSVLSSRDAGPVFGPLEKNRSLCWALAAVGAALAVLSLVVWSHVDWAVLISGAVVVALVLYLVGRVRMPVPSRRVGWLIDAVALIVVILAVPDMVIFPSGPGVASPDPFITYVVQFHQNLFLGPASQVLDGQVLLVDTVSQYGIGSIYLISAFFELAPIGHGTLGFLDGALSALVVGTGYLILRAAGVRRVLAIPAIAVAVAILAWGPTYPVGGLLQHGAIRYGMPILVIAAATAGGRWPRYAGPARWFCLAVVGLSSIWALEAFLYTLATWLGLVALGAVLAERDRVRWLVRSLLETLGAMVAFHLLFALATLAASGSLPDWSLYLTYLKDFTTGEIGDLTYDYVPWAPGLGVAAFYLAAVVALVAAIRSRRDLVLEHRTEFIALAGSLSYGIALYSYYVNRSLDHVLPYLLLPMILAVTIALGLIMRKGSRGLRLTALGSAMAVSLFAISAVGKDLPDSARDSLLAYSVPGGKSVKAGFERLWDPPPLTPGADEAERLLETEMPGEDRSAVLTQSDLSVEALARAGRANSLGFTDPKENSWVPGPNRPIISEAIDDLEPGDLMLVDQVALDFLAGLDDPAADPEALAASLQLEPLQGEALVMIDERFVLKPVAEGAGGLEVVRLETRPAG